MERVARVKRQRVGKMDGGDGKCEKGLRKSQGVMGMEDVKRG